MISISNKKNNKTVRTGCTVNIPGVKLRIAVVADLHNSPWEEVAEILSGASPDIIACPGDLFGSLAEDSTPAGHLSARYIGEANNNEIGFAFLRAAGKIAPVFCSVGNHEARVSAANRRRIAQTGAVMLDNSHAVMKNGLLIGGLSTGGAHGLFRPTEPPDTGWLCKFAELRGPKILLCHHPEYWYRYVAPLGIELTIAGHAHGGQWRFFGRGVLSPGQGLFPKYTSGTHRRGNSVMVVSRGLLPGGRVPRINNPPEVMIIDVNR